MNRKTKIAILVVLDSVINISSSLFAYYFMKPYVAITKDFFIGFIPLCVVSYLVFGFVFRVFNRINRYTNLREIIAIFFSTTSSALLNLLVTGFLWEMYSRRFVILSYIVSTLLIVGSRLVWRLMIEQKNRKLSAGQRRKRTLIIGAGEGGRILLNSLSHSITNQDLDIIGLVDDNPDKANTYLNNAKVLGTTKELLNLIDEYKVEMITIAIPSISKQKLTEIVSLVNTRKIQITTMPSMEELTSGKVKVSRLRDVDVIDLLGREEVELDMYAIKDQLTNQVILITGAGGSIGSEIARQVMNFTPKQVILLGHGENSIYLIEKELRTYYSGKNTELIPVIADIQDRKRIFEVIKQYQPDIIYHAAAHKHVPLMEHNPHEAVKNNIFGTKNVAEAAKEHQVKNFVMISTDKAVNPPNVMGATKRIAEMIVMGLNETGQTKFSAVRFGNVLGSRGSVIPVFKEQILQGGPVTVTDFRMTRYFMTIPEASRLVIQSGALAEGGEIFILDMGEPVKIVDLAKNVIRLSGYTENEIPIIESGIRPGEKLYEELLVSKEKNPQQVYEKIFVGNVKGFSLAEVEDFINHLSEEQENLSRILVEYANESSK